MNSAYSATPARTSLSLLWQRIWRLPTLTVARFTLRSYVRSGWILGDVVYIWFLYAFLFFEFGGNVSYFYGTAGQGLGLLAILDTIVIVQRSLKTARVYLPLSRLTSRAAYIRGLILATAILRVPTFLLTLLLAAGYHRHIPILGIQGATLANMLPGALGLLLNCILISTLTAILSAPVATRMIQIVFLGWVAVVLYVNSGSGPIVQYLAVSHIPLIPVLTCYSFGLNPALDGYSLAMVLVMLVYIAGLTWLAAFWLGRRDLILQ